MPVKFCPRCQQPFVVSNDNTDYVHDCGNTPLAAEALKNEDVPNTGTYADPDGSSGRTAPVNAGLQGAENKASPRAVFDGVREHDRTSRGNVKTTHRTRKHYEYQTFENDNVCSDQQFDKDII